MLSNLMKKILLFALVSLLSCSGLVAQEERYPSGVLLSTRPQTLLLGVDLGVEVPLNSKWSIGGEAIAHAWWDIPKNIALKPSVKWYFWGTTGRGWYLRMSPIIGYFLNKPYDGYRYYGGGGFGIGWQSPFVRGSRWHVIGDAGLKLAVPFGACNCVATKGRTEDQKMRSHNDFYYMAIASPAAPIDLSIGIAYRF